MIVVTNDLLMLPIVVVLWVVQAYIGLVALRIWLSCFARLRNGPFLSAVILLTDRPVHLIESWLASRRGRNVPSWQTWTIVIITTIVVQYVLIAVIATGMS